MKFVFDSDSLEVVLGNEAKETENAFVGGENKWKFSTFTNWEFWWPNFPVLVYFKVQIGGHLYHFHINPLLQCKTLLASIIFGRVIMGGLCYAMEYTSLSSQQLRALEHVLYARKAACAGPH